VGDLEGQVGDEVVKVWRGGKQPGSLMRPPDGVAGTGEGDPTGIESGGVGGVTRNTRDLARSGVRLLDPFQPRN